jgi:two-component system cell cycle sensor histidine kinase/response regulator CckA
LLIDDSVIGTLAVQSDSLVEGDIPAITAFAYQIAAAWHRALLFEQSQQELARRRQAEEARALLATVVEQAAEMVIVTDTKGTIQYVNPAFERVTGYTSGEAVGQNPRLLKSGRQGQDFYADLWKTVASGHVWHGRFVNKRKDGVFYTEDATITPVRDDEETIVNYVAVKRDISDELELEERYRQSQKMEAIGRLAGGVAHDFNNLLTVIQGYTAFVLDELEPGDALLEDLEEISRAGERASALTFQLLAFSRRQVFQPKAVNLNLLIEGSTKMLRRLIGEDIELHLMTDPALGQVLADPGQIEQVIMNLSVNARDAMPQGGNLIFETANVSLDQAYAEVHPGVEPGAYVRLVVADSGTGMTKDVKAHLFEPFFTTKGQGHGTGLGLATVWGIVEQSGGHIEVESELGIGTTFKVYLPRVDKTVDGEDPPQTGNALPGGSETILLVEDEDPVRELTCRMLESQGYTVLEAGHPDQALLASEQHTGDIDLLVSDVVMPGMGGPALAEQLLLSRPQLKVLYVSGYTDDAIIRHGVLEHGIPFLQKPFAPDELAHKVREALESPNST